MSTKLKLYLGRKVIESLNRPTKFTPTEILPLIQIGNNHGKNIEMNLPLEILEYNLGITNINEILKIQPDDIIKSINLHSDRANRKLSFEIDRNIFIKDVVENCAKPEVNLKPKTVVYEYSSPNVAKPFHLGHLRSTMIGNFLSNLSRFLQNNVTSLNYLGDWGTQFGYIVVGVRELNYTSEDIKRSPLRLLYESYVHANKLAEKNPDILNQAKEEFSKLENGSPKDIARWKEYMGYSKDELVDIYKRLGVSFDAFNYESMYSAKDIDDIVKMLQDKNIIHKAQDGKQVAKVKDRTVSIVKSDGSTLYLTRDIAAAMDRYEKYKFDKMFYVVDNAQSDHFNALKEILYSMDVPWANRINHIKFGRIRGMSSRKGNAVFLKDILDECRDLMVQRQISSPTTKVPIDNPEISDILAVSCVLINDLKQRRQKDYEFKWDTVLQVQGDTGIKLQYTHCRLYSLEQLSGAVRPPECIPNMIEEPEVTALVKQLAGFQHVLYRADEQFEACILVTYLFHLCNHINRAFKVLKVKGSDPDIASQRLLIFITAREVLNAGMKILGMQPLNQM